MKKVILLLLAVLMISTVFVGCDKNLASALASKAKHISLNPDIINVKVGETIEVTAKITDGNDQTVTVDNSKFEWSIVYGNEAIEIEPNGGGHSIKIKAKKKIIGNAMIKISHPDALNHIQRVVHITEGESSGGGNTGNEGEEGGTVIPEEEKGDIFFSTDGTSSAQANYGSFKIQNGKSRVIRVEIRKTEGSDSLEIDNTKFEWTKSLYPDLIDIEPNGNTIKITVKKKDGNKEPRIKVTHPYAKKAGRLDIEITQ